MRAVHNPKRQRGTRRGPSARPRLAALLKRAANAAPRPSLTLRAVILCVVATASPAPAQGDPAWERDPYDVRLSLAAPPAALPADAEAMLAGLLWNTYGQSWGVTFAPPPAALARLDAVGLRRLSAADFPPPAAPPETDDDGNVTPPADPPPDRWFVVTAAPDGAGNVEVAAREWDAARRALGRTATATAATPAGAVRAAAKLVRELFHPTYKLSPPPGAAPGSSDVLVTARAAALPTRDPAADPLAPGTLLDVSLRLYARDGSLREVRVTPLTFVTIAGEPDPADPARAVRGAVVSPFRTAVGRTRGRNETLARPVAQPLDSTTLRLVSRGGGRPLVGYRVLVADRRVLPSEVKRDKDDPPPDPIPEPVELVSDRRGRVVVPAAPPAFPGEDREGEEREKGLVWLHVYSGKAKLATLPYVAGSQPEDTLELDDDALRLGLEGEYALLSGEMIDVVAARAVLIARAKKAAKENDFEAAADRLAELAELDRAPQFRRRVDTLAAGVRAQAEASGDRLTAARVGKLAEKMRELADAYLSGDPLREAQEEVAELRALAEDVRRAKERADRRGGRRDRR